MRVQFPYFQGRFWLMKPSVAATALVFYWWSLCSRGARMDGGSDSVRDFGVCHLMLRVQHPRSGKGWKDHEGPFETTFLGCVKYRKIMRNSRSIRSVRVFKVLFLWWLCFGVALGGQLSLNWLMRCASLQTQFYKYVESSCRSKNSFGLKFRRLYPCARGKSPESTRRSASRISMLNFVFFKICSFLRVLSVEAVQILTTVSGAARQEQHFKIFQIHFFYPTSGNRRLSQCHQSCHLRTPWDLQGWKTHLHSGPQWIWKDYATECRAPKSPLLESVGYRPESSEVLAGRQSGGQRHRIRITGQVWISGQRVDPRLVRSRIAYVTASVCCNSSGPYSDADMEVSINGGSPKWMVYNGKSYWNGWFWGYPGYPHFRKPPYDSSLIHSFTLSGDAKRWDVCHFHSNGGSSGWSSLHL